MVSEKKHISQ